MVQARFCFDSVNFSEGQSTIKYIFYTKTLISVLHSDTWNTMCVLCNYIIEMNI